MGKFGARSFASKRSGFEDRVADYFKHNKIPVEYEAEKIKYILPASNHSYTPDFRIGPNKFIETKGRWDAADRKKMLLIKEQHPEITIYMLFMKSQNTISPKSRTTYAAFCDKHGIEWADYNLHEVPEEWLK